MWLSELKEEWSAAQNILAASKWVEKNVSSMRVSTEVNGKWKYSPFRTCPKFSLWLLKGLCVLLMYFLLTTLLLKLGHNVLEKSVQSVKFTILQKSLLLSLLEKSQCVANNGLWECWVVFVSLVCQAYRKCSEHVRCLRRHTYMAFYELPRRLERESHLTWVNPGIYLKYTVVRRFSSIKYSTSTK